MSKVDEAFNSLNASIMSANTDLDLKYLRPFQKTMYLCAAKCMDISGDRSSIEQCVSRCNQPVTAAQQVMQQELQRFQEGFGRCQQRCSDSVMNKATGSMSDGEMRASAEGCVITCVDEFKGGVPPMISRITRALEGFKTP